jgi:hypothetical protein
MRLKFRPKRVTDFAEMPQWIFRINDQDRFVLEKKDKQKAVRHPQGDTK